MTMDKNDFHKYKRFLVVDAETGKPMAFQDNQFCYCSSELWQDEHWPARVYSYNKAKDLIRKTKRYRKRKGFEVGEYLLVPIKL